MSGPAAGLGGVLFAVPSDFLSSSWFLLSVGIGSILLILLVIGFFRMVNPSCFQPSEHIIDNMPPRQRTQESSAQGYPTQGYSAQGYPTQSYPTQSYPTQAHPTPQPSPGGNSMRGDMPETPPPANVDPWGKLTNEVELYHTFHIENGVVVDRDAEMIDDDEGPKLLPRERQHTMVDMGFGPDPTHRSSRANTGQYEDWVDGGDLGDTNMQAGDLAPGGLSVDRRGSHLSNSTQVSCGQFSSRLDSSRQSIGQRAAALSQHQRSPEGYELWNHSRQDSTSSNQPLVHSESNSLYEPASSLRRKNRSIRSSTQNSIGRTGSMRSSDVPQQHLHLQQQLTIQSYTGDGSAESLCRLSESSTPTPGKEWTQTYEF